MALPDSRNRTYADGVTQIPAGDMNGLQDNEVDLWAATRGADLLIADHFIGGVVDTGLWGSGAAGGAVPATFTTAIESSARGALKWTATPTTSATIASLSMDLGTSDFRFIARERTSSTGGATSSARFGVYDINAATGCYFISNATAWDGVIDGSTHNFADLISSTYKTFEIRRESNVISFIVNGVTRYSAAYATALSTVYVAARGDANTSGTETFYLDLVKLWARS